MLIRLDGVSFAYPGAAPLLERTDLGIEAGEYLLVRGPSGVGKSTLLRLLCRLEEPTGGTLHFDGTPYADLAPAELRRKAAYVQQTPTLEEGTVRRNLLLPFSFKSNAALQTPDDNALRNFLAEYLLDGVSLEDEAKSLSVGQAQRVCLLRTRLLSPRVLLMDEPTSALDPKSAAVVLESARQLRDEGVTIVMISHSEAVPDGVTGLLRIGNRTVERA
ncbi:ABC transporter ATP-binding protein [Salidesulfovibrio onnuriiensis]|uniref:ABC transporter ATP-binding protein n=1 Tax=Salidesulfovibrio onnuriiensis TaxID=2583823 RepID=UPI0011CCBBE7|nr:ABC transporter ATP-binding protein [Salidesulfovibrio onnuriiensis]